MSRLGQRITIPFLLTHDLNPYVAFFSTVLPIASYVAVHHFIIIPRKRRRIAQSVSTIVMSQRGVDRGDQAGQGITNRTCKLYRTEEDRGSRSVDDDGTAHCIKTCCRAGEAWYLATLAQYVFSLMK